MWGKDVGPAWGLCYVGKAGAMPSDLGIVVGVVAQQGHKKRASVGLLRRGPPQSVGVGGDTFFGRHTYIQADR